MNPRVEFWHLSPSVSDSPVHVPQEVRRDQAGSVWDTQEGTKWGACLPWDVRGVLCTGPRFPGHATLWLYFATSYGWESVTSAGLTSWTKVTELVQRKDGRKGWRVLKNSQLRGGVSSFSFGLFQNKLYHSLNLHALSLHKNSITVSRVLFFVCIWVT